LGAFYVTRSKTPTQVLVPPSTPMPTGASATVPAPTPTPAPVAYGYVHLAAPGRIVLRSERDGSPVFEFTGVSPAVSSDGKRLAYWRTGTPISTQETDVFSPKGVDLRILDVADPITERTVFSAPGDTYGANIVWSNDGQGLLIATYSRETVGGAGLGSGTPARYDLVMLDLTTTPATQRPAATQVSRGFVYLPVAWDRPGQIAAGVVTGEGGFVTEYVTWNGNGNPANPFTRTPLRNVIAGTVQASADAKFLMGGEAGGVRIWPINDVSKSSLIQRPSPISNPFWRSGPGYFTIWSIGVPTQTVEMTQYGTDGSIALYTVSGTDRAYAAASRPDGSAVLVIQSGPSPRTDPPAPATKLVIVDVATKQAGQMWTTTGDLRILPRGLLLR
jgi:hypothetical protein